LVADLADSFRFGGQNVRPNQVARAWRWQVELYNYT